MLEMSGHPKGIRRAFKMLRRGGRISLLGIPSKAREADLANDIIFKGAVVQGINERRVFESWCKMQALPRSGALDLSRLIVDRIPLSDFERGMEVLLSGNASKVLMYPNGVPLKWAGEEPGGLHPSSLKSQASNLTVQVSPCL